MFTPEEKSAFTTIFEKSNFKFFTGGKYYFKNSQTASNKMFLKTIGFPEVMKKYEQLKDLRLKFAEKEFPENDLDSFVEEFSEGKYEVRKSPVVEGMNDNNKNIDEYISKLVPVIDLRAKAKTKIMLLSPSNGMRPIYTLDIDMYLMKMKTSLEQLVADENTTNAISIFNPYRLEPLYKDKIKGDSFEMTYINTYVPAPWRFVEGIKPSLEGFIKDLVDHLFPIEEEKEAVLDWLHYSLVRRCETVLCLVGARGTGKGLLLGDIQSQLIGEEYRENVNQEILREKFNAAFKGKRYIFFDEVDISGPAERSKFKAFANNTIVVEEKGEDSETIENFTSMGLTSNEKSHIEVLPQDRRFSVPRVTDRPFIGNVYSYEEVADFVDRIKDPQNREIAAFGQFLLNRKPKTKSQVPIKGEYYFELCRLSMPEWQLFVIDYFMYQGEKNTPVTISDLKKQFTQQYGKESKFPNKQGTYESFLGDYLHKGVYKIGKVVSDFDHDKQRKTFALLPDELFLDNFRVATAKKVEEEESLLGGLDDMLMTPPPKSMEVKKVENPQDRL